jgi:SAM-dependent methyltransferase
MRSDLYDVHHQLENTHWWFTARRRIVLGLLRRMLPEMHVPAGAEVRVADIGCGTGGMLRHLTEFGSVTGVDPSPEAVAYAKAPGVDVRHGSLPDGLPFRPDERFHVVTMLDVLEHVEDDVAALRAVHGCMEPAGRLLLTVPAGQFLWSGHDVVNHHFRRYSRRVLADRLRAAGFRIRYLSYYNSILFLPIAGVRLLHRLTAADGGDHDVRMPAGPVNAMLHRVFAAERLVLGSLRLPFGISLIAVASPEGNAER